MDNMYDSFDNDLKLQEDTTSLQSLSSELWGDGSMLLLKSTETMFVENEEMQKLLGDLYITDESLMSSGESEDGDGDLGQWDGAEPIYGRFDGDQITNFGDFDLSEYELEKVSPELSLQLEPFIVESRPDYIKLSDGTQIERIGSILRTTNPDGTTIEQDAFTENTTYRTPGGRDVYQALESGDSNGYSVEPDFNIVRSVIDHDTNGNYYSGIEFGGRWVTRDAFGRFDVQPRSGDIPGRDQMGRPTVTSADGRYTIIQHSDGIEVFIHSLQMSKRIYSDGRIVTGGNADSSETTQFVNGDVRTVSVGGIARTQLQDGVVRTEFRGILGKYIMQYPWGERITHYPNNTESTIKVP